MYMGHLYEIWRLSSLVSTNDASVLFHNITVISKIFAKHISFQLQLFKKPWKPALARYLMSPFGHTFGITKDFGVGPFLDMYSLRSYF